MNIEYRVHWLSITIWTSFEDMKRIWDHNFRQIFGELISKKHGGSGFRLIHESVGKIQVYSEPINVGMDQDQYISLRIPGSACDALDLLIGMALCHIIVSYY